MNKTKPGASAIEQPAEEKPAPLTVAPTETHELVPASGLYIMKDGVRVLVEDAEPVMDAPPAE